MIKTGGRHGAGKNRRRGEVDFYGWVVVAASAVIYGLAGVGLFCFGIFIKPMSQDFGWARADVVSEKRDTGYGLSCTFRNFIQLLKPGPPPHKAAGSSKGPVRVSWLCR